MAVVPLIVICLVVLVFLAKVTVDDVVAKNLLLARSVSGEIEGFLREPLSVLQNVRGILKTSSDLEGEAIEQILNSHIGHTDLFESIYVLNREGIVTAVGLPGGESQHRKDYLGLDLSHRSYFLQARATGKPAWSDTFLSLFTGKMAVAIGLVIDERVLVGSFNLDIFSRFTGRLGSEDRVTTTITDLNAGTTVELSRSFTATAE